MADAPPNKEIRPRLPTRQIRIDETLGDLMPAVCVLIGLVKTFNHVKRLAVFSFQGAATG